MSKKQKKMLTRILVSAALLALARLLNLSGFLGVALYLIPYTIIGWDVLWKAIRNIARGQVFDENFLMALATVGAIFLGEYIEASAVMLFYQVGELFQSYAVGRSRQSISTLMDIRPDYANIEKDGTVCKVDPDDVAVGDIILVQPGEKIPLDGIVLEGASSIDTAALTGESVPQDVSKEDAVISGCVNISGLLRIQVTKPFGESTVSKILELVENASSKKAKAENFITKFARYYTPAVVIGAVLLALIPPLIIGGGFLMWIQRALTFLVISCPCALVISIPLSFFGGIGGASRQGILMKGGSYLEALGETGTIVFDKTGTLTKGSFSVTEIVPHTGSKEALLEYAALAESYSNHPISLSLKKAWGGTIDAHTITQVEEIPGHGVSATVNGKRVSAGNARLLQSLDIIPPAVTTPGTVIHVAIDSTYTGYLVIADTCKPDAAATIQQLNACGIHTVMLTGDTQATADQIAQTIGIQEVHAQLLPADKVAQVEQLLSQMPKGKKLAFVGDGVNDAPVLSRADIGIAMGAMGSDAAIEAADIVLMDDAPSKILTAMQISQKTLRIVRQNIVFALGIKGLCLILGALGLAGMWAAVFADVGVAVIAILNAMRALGKKN